MGDCNKHAGQIQKNQFKIQIIIINSRLYKIQQYRICCEKKCLKQEGLLFTFFERDGRRFAYLFLQKYVRARAYAGGFFI